MKFEKWKAQWRGSGERQLSLTRFLGRLRYPPRWHGDPSPSHCSTSRAVSWRAAERGISRS